MKDALPGALLIALFSAIPTWVIVGAWREGRHGLTKEERKELNQLIAIDDKARKARRKAKKQAAKDKLARENRERLDWFRENAGTDKKRSPYEDD